MRCSSSFSSAALPPLRCSASLRILEKGVSFIGPPCRWTHYSTDSGFAPVRLHLSGVTSMRCDEASPSSPRRLATPKLCEGGRAGPVSLFQRGSIRVEKMLGPRIRGDDDGDLICRPANAERR